MFETGILEEGNFVLTNEEVWNCKVFSLKLLYLCGQVFPRESAAYNLLQDVDNESINSNFNEWDASLIDSLTKEVTFTNGNANQNWILTASKHRLTNKVGRNIASRYYTKLNSK